MMVSVKNNSIYLRPFSLAWVNYHCAANTLLTIGIASLYRSIADFTRGLSDEEWHISLLLLGSGLIIFWFQVERLKLKRISIPSRNDSLKDAIRKLLTENEWDIRCNSNYYLEAICTKGIPILDEGILILQWKSKEILWGTIHNPRYCGIGGIVTRNRYGRKIGKKLKKLVADLATEQTRMTKH